MQEGIGHIIYDGEGHMAVHITPKDYSTKKVNWQNKIDSLGLENYRPEFELFNVAENQATLANNVYVSKCKNHLWEYY